MASDSLAPFDRVSRPNLTLVIALGVARRFGSDYGIPPLHDTSISISDCAIDGTGTV